MRKLFFTLVLGLATLGLSAVTPNSADAGPIIRRWGRPNYGYNYNYAPNHRYYR